MKKIRTYGDPRVFLCGVILICVLIGAVVITAIFREEAGAGDREGINEHFDIVMATIMLLGVPVLANDFIPTEVEFDSEQINKKHLVFRSSMKVQDITDVKCRIMVHIGSNAVEIQISGRGKKMHIYDKVVNMEEVRRIRNGNSDKEIMELYSYLKVICPEKMTTDWKHLPKE